MPKVAPIPDAAPGRLGRTRRVSSALAEINVVPLVDVMLVLLIIFMVTAPMIQRGIDVNLPVSTKAGQITNERVFVTVPLGYRENHILYLGGDPIRADVLQERIRQKMENRSDKQVYLLLIKTQVMAGNAWRSQSQHREDANLRYQAARDNI